jgi:hypothetical protein
MVLVRLPFSASSLLLNLLQNKKKRRIEALNCEQYKYYVLPSSPYAIKG